jgi:hypothetical protein
VSQSKVRGYEKKEAARALKDAAETGFPLSPDEATALQLAAAGDPACYEREFSRILGDAIERNPRTDLRWARDDARRLKDIVGNDWDLLDAVDQAVLSRASRAKDITRAQIKEIEKRFSEKQHEAAVTQALLNPDQWSRAMRHPRETWARIIEKRRTEARSPRHREALRRLVLFSKAEATSNDWMGFGTREAYLQAIGATIEIVAWAAEGRFLWPEPDPDGFFRFGLGFFGGPDAMTSASRVPAQEWDALLDNRRREVREIGELCRLPAFAVYDAAATPDWMGYGSREAYLHRGLSITEDLVAWACEGLHLFGLSVEPKGRRYEDLLAVLDLPMRGEARLAPATSNAVGPEGDA